jgi:Family of unknown function (DUF5684)
MDMDIGAIIAAAMVPIVISLILTVVIIIAMWKVFTKAGKPGWASLVPIYNTIVLLEIIGKPVWWFLLLMIPCVNIIIAFIVCIELAKSFGKEAGFGIGLALLGVIFFPILGFGSARYIGPGGQRAGGAGGAGNRRRFEDDE